MSPAVDDALLRVAQEALTNVGRHATASHVDVTLSYLDDLVLLDVQDDGVGSTRPPRPPTATSCTAVTA